MRPSQVSAFQTLKLSVGPSSSHTHGPILIGNRFRQSLAAHPQKEKGRKLKVALCWSLARTGIGHRTHNAIVAGLMGYDPIFTDLDLINTAYEKVAEEGLLDLGFTTIPFDPYTDVQFLPDIRLPEHENGMTLSLLDEAGGVIFEKNYYSVGGGMIREEGQVEGDSGEPEPYPYQTAREWLQFAKNDNLKLSEIVKQNTARLEGLTIAETFEQMRLRWETMKRCVERGLSPKDAILPGVLKVKRRAPRLFEAAKSPRGTAIFNKQDIVTYATAFAYAVSEENAASGRVVTAPTNGGAGVLPGVLYACTFVHRFSDDEIVECLFTAAGIGGLIQANASISGSEVGCQGEVGAACSMASGALAQLYEGDIYDVEYAAEIAMEHSLGLECTPMKGYVQIPCIERNGIFAAKALSAAQHAITLKNHRISLDLVINKMLENGHRMHTDFKETSSAGFGPIEPDLEF